LLTAASVQGMKNALAALGESLRTGEVVDRPDLLVSFEELNGLVGISELEQLEQRYLTREQLRRKYENATHETNPQYRDVAQCPVTPAS